MDRLWIVCGRCMAWVSLSAACLMVVWASVALILRDMSMASAFGHSGGICALVGFMLWRLVPPQPTMLLDITHGLLLTISLWLWLALLTALPFYWGGLSLSFLDSFFYTISGITTTGFGVLSPSISLGNILAMWWGFLQWLGGFGLMMSLILLVPMLRNGPQAIIPAESSDRTVKTSPKSVTMVQNMMGIYLGLTIIFALLFHWVGALSWLESWTWSMACLSTGGITCTSSVITDFSTSSKILLCAAMLSGSVTFYWWVGLLSGKWSAVFRDEQVRFGLGWLIFIFALIFWIHPQHSLIDILTTTCTALSGTGFALGSMASLIEPIFMLTTIVGGCSGSASGGCKLFRIHMLWRLAANVLKKTSDPKGFYPVVYQGKIISFQDLSTVITIIACYVFGWLVTTLLLMLDLHPFSQAWGMASSAISNSGYMYTGWETGAQWSQWTKTVLITAMLFGRFEGLSLLGAGYVLWTRVKSHIRRFGKNQSHWNVGGGSLPSCKPPANPTAMRMRGTKQGAQDNV